MNGPSWRHDYCYYNSRSEKHSETGYNIIFFRIELNNSLHLREKIDMGVLGLGPEWAIFTDMWRDFTSGTSNPSTAWMVDHSILLHRLQHWFGLHGTSLDWFSSISPHRSQAVSSKIPLHLSQIFLVVYLKVPSLAHFFSLFIQLLLALSSRRTQTSTTFYADDTQLYISFTPSNSTSSLEMLSNTFSDILSWMNSNKLLLNPSKTEFLLIGTKQQRLKFSQLTTLSLGNDIIPVSSSARNLGFIFDSDMSFTDQINSLSKSCHFHIRDIRRIRHLLPLSAATALANSLVSSKLDYCNSLYNGISQANLNKIQRIQNTLARVVTNTSKFEHITPILKKLHWLPIRQ